MQWKEIYLKYSFKPIPDTAYFHEVDDTVLAGATALMLEVSSVELHTLQQHNKT